MDFRESLDYLYGLQRFGIKLGLENIRALLDRLGRPEGDYPVVHVAGTNGKGSVCACLAEILGRAGLRTGLYTSPHLHSFTERIRVGGLSIPEPEVARLTGEIRAAAQGIPATFFEFTTALALQYFREQKVDFAVLETGMGGRLDATNAVLPQVCIITSISHDHAHHLGTDLAAIAREKAGILKPGVPLVLGKQEPSALEAILDKARECGSPVFFHGRDFDGVPAGEGFDYRSLDLRLTGLTPGLPGRHQVENFSLSLCAAELLRRQGAPLDPESFRAGVAHVRWPGRLEWWQGEDKILLDGAHNEGGARALGHFLESLGKPVRWVVGLKGDKEAREVLQPVLPRVRALYCTSPPVEEAVSPALLKQVGEDSGVPATVFGTPAEALRSALADRQGGEVVLVAGSLFLVAAAREWLQTHGGWEA